MYTRTLSTEKDSFFLFGPRGVGKSTWVRSHYPKAHIIDLLRTENFLKYQREPGELRKEVRALKKGSWIIIDEIQKLPMLLDEVHALIQDFSNQYKFILTGSSARKLKREGANLLAGRAYTRLMFPLTLGELESNIAIEDVLKYGTLPSVMNAEDSKDKVARLSAYVETYLREEIQQEAVVKNLSSFSRFLKITGIVNGQKLNIASVARDAGVERSTVQGYFQILKDTLVGELLPPWPLKFRVKEVDHPKFYYFDTGVVRALTNMLHEPIDSIEKGFLLETLVVNELKAINSYKKLGYEFYYWGTHAGAEVDLIISRGKRAIGIEVKSSSSWKSEYSKNLKLLFDGNKISKGIGLYLGDTELKDGEISVFPLKDFLLKLNRNEFTLID